MKKKLESFYEKNIPRGFSQGTNISQENNDNCHKLAKRFKKENTPESLEMLEILIEAGHSPDAVVIANISPEQEKKNIYEQEHIKELQISEISEEKT